MFKHPSKVCLSYLKHMKFSFHLSYHFGKASACAFVHGIYPDIFITHSSDTIQKLTNDMNKIGCRKNKTNMK